MRRTAIAAVLCGVVCACGRSNPPPPPVTAPSQPAPARPATLPTAVAPDPAPQPVEGAMGKERAKEALNDAPRKVHVTSAAPAPKPPSADALQRFVGTSRGAGGLGLRGTGAGGGGDSYGSGGGRLSGGAGKASAGSISVGSIGTKGHGGGIGYGGGSYVAAPSYGRMGPAVVSNPVGVTGEDPNASNAFHDYGVNPFTTAEEDHLSTFAADVDTASYAISRRAILTGSLPDTAAVRVEEFLNYFHYTYAPPQDDRPLEVHLDAAPSPFTQGKTTLLRVGVQAKQLKSSERKPLHLTFLVDVSGSMESADRLPLAKRALRILVDSLRDGDTVALCTYAGAVKDVLGPTGMEQKAKIYSAIEDLHAGGSTAMSSGLDLAYRNAMKTLSSNSISRVLVLTDGDANVGPSTHQDLVAQIQKYAKEGVTLTTVGFGMGNLKDETLEQMADKGNGNYYYVDSLMQARRVFHEQLGSTLEVIAQDVKIQVEFDPKQVKRYRLAGYENRAIADKDFRNDKVDAGEVGSGHTVTALYELELQPGAQKEGLATVRIRAKKPRGEKADEWAFPLHAAAFAPAFEQASQDFRFASAVMAAAERLRRSPYAQGWDFDQIIRVARAAAPPDSAERQEFIQLLEKSKPLVGAVAAAK